MAHVCSACVAALEPDDSHDHCPSCLGFEHLRSAQPDRPPRRGRAVTVGAPPRKRTKGKLASKVDRLSSDMVRIQELLLTLQPGAGGGVADPDPSLGDGPNMDDALSLAALANLFNERVTKVGTLNTAGETSYSSARSSGHSTECTPMGAVIRRIQRNMGWVACRPLSPLLPPSFWPPIRL